eukprot:GHVT01094543.1.p1 GENE.GHVT01094543.1~~GHVT01094543.1.p1  ORF type:complete len:553 (+),score=116.96 GHVT01094543.1:590-2248(+)
MGTTCLDVPALLGKLGAIEGESSGSFEQLLGAAPLAASSFLALPPPMTAEEAAMTLPPPPPSPTRLIFVLCACVAAVVGAVLLCLCCCCRRRCCGCCPFGLCSLCDCVAACCGGGRSSSSRRRRRRRKHYWADHSAGSSFDGDLSPHIPRWPFWIPPFYPPGHLPPPAVTKSPSTASSDRPPGASQRQTQAEIDPQTPDASTRATPLGRLRAWRAALEDRLAERRDIAAGRPRRASAPAVVHEPAPALCVAAAPGPMLDANEGVAGSLAPPRLVPPRGRRGSAPAVLDLAALNAPSAKRREHSAPIAPAAPRIPVALVDLPPQSRTRRGSAPLLLSPAPTSHVSTRRGSAPLLLSPAPTSHVSTRRGSAPSASTAAALASAAAAAGAPDGLRTPQYNPSLVGPGGRPSRHAVLADKPSGRAPPGSVRVRPETQPGSPAASTAYTVDDGPTVLPFARAMRSRDPQPSCVVIALAPEEPRWTTAHVLASVGSGSPLPSAAIVAQDPSATVGDYPTLPVLAHPLPRASWSTATTQPASASAAPPPLSPMDAPHEL